MQSTFRLKAAAADKSGSIHTTLSINVFLAQLQCLNVFEHFHGGFERIGYLKVSEVPRCLIN